MTIEARATRVGGWWAVEAEHADRPIFAQARRLDQVEGMVRGAFEAVGVDVSTETITVRKMRRAPALLIEQAAQTETESGDDG